MLLHSKLLPSISYTRNPQSSSNEELDTFSHTESLQQRSIIINTVLGLSPTKQKRIISFIASRSLNDAIALIKRLGLSESDYTAYLKKTIFTKELIQRHPTAMEKIANNITLDANLKQSIFKVLKNTTNKPVKEIKKESLPKTLQELGKTIDNYYAEQIKCKKLGALETPFNPNSKIVKRVETFLQQAITFENPNYRGFFAHLGHNSRGDLTQDLIKEITGKLKDEENLVKIDGVWTIEGSEGESMIREKEEISLGECISVDEYKNGFALVGKNNDDDSYGDGYIDIYGKFFPFFNGCIDHFNPEGYIIISSNEKSNNEQNSYFKTLTDIKGKEILSCKNVSYYGEGKYLCENKENTCRYFDVNTMKYLPIEFEYDVGIYDFKGGIGIIQNEGYQQYINKDGKIISDKYLYLVGFENGYGMGGHNDTDNIDIIDKNGISILQIVLDECDDLCEYKNGYFYNKKANDTSDFIDIKGNVISLEYGSTKKQNNFSHGYIGLKKKNNKEIYLDSAFKEVSKEYKQVSEFSEGYARVSNEEGKWFFIDTNFQEYNKKLYNYPQNFENGYAIIQREEFGKKGLINNKGREVLPYIYKEISIIENNGQKIALCSRNGEDGNHYLDRIPLDYPLKSELQLLQLLDEGGSINAYKKYLHNKSNASEYHNQMKKNGEEYNKSQALNTHLKGIQQQKPELLVPVMPSQPIYDNTILKYSKSFMREDEYQKQKNDFIVEGDNDGFDYNNSDIIKSGKPLENQDNQVENCTFSPGYTGFLITGIYSNHHNGKWIRSPLKNSIQVSDSSKKVKTHPAFKTTGWKVIPQGANDMITDIIATDKKGRNIILPIEITDQGSTIVKIDDPSVTLSYTLIQNTIPPIPSTSNEQYSNFLKTVEHTYNKTYTKNDIELPYEAQVFLKSINYLSPREKIFAIEDFLVESFIYDKKNSDTENEKMDGKPLQKQIEIMIGRANEIIEKTGEDYNKLFAEVCRGIAAVRFAMRRNTGIACTYLRGYQSNGKSVSSQNDHGCCGALFPDGNGGMVHIPIDSMKGNGNSTESLGGSAELLRQEAIKEKNLKESQGKETLQSYTLLSTQEKIAQEKLILTQQTHTINQLIEMFDNTEGSGKELLEAAIAQKREALSDEQKETLKSKLFDNDIIEI